MSRSLVVHTDGGSRGNPGPAGYGAVITDAATGRVLAERSEYLGEVSNNVAEYRGVIAGLEACKEIDADAAVEVRADSNLVVQQLSGKWKIKHPDMKTLALQAKKILPAGQVTYTWVPRAQNKAADALANKAMDTRTSHHTDAWREDEGTDAGATQESVPDAAPAATEPTTGASAATAPDTRPLAVASGRPEGTPATLLLVRHGVTEHTMAQVLSGGDVPGPDLSEAGRAQAARAAEIIARAPQTWSGVEAATRLLHSPLVRTTSTAAVLGERLGLTPQEDERLVELFFGDWNALPVAQVSTEHGEEFEKFIGTGRHKAPQGESLLDVGRRVGALMSELAEQHTGTTTVAVSHAVAIRSVMGLALGADPARWWMIRIPPASVSVLRLWPGKDEGDGPRVEVVAMGVPGELIDQA